MITLLPALMIGLKIYLHDNNKPKKWRRRRKKISFLELQKRKLKIKLLNLKIPQYRYPKTDGLIYHS
jgi:hypothetical protein